jgi:hypothetical protein
MVEEDLLLKGKFLWLQILVLSLICIFLLSPLPATPPHTQKKFLLYCFSLRSLPISALLSVIALYIAMTAAIVEMLSRSKLV